MLTFASLTLFIAIKNLHRVVFLTGIAPVSICYHFISEISRDISSASSSGGSNKRPINLSAEMKTNVKEPRSNKTQRKITEVAAGDEDYSDVFLDKDRSLNHLKEVKWSEAAVERLKELTLDGKQRMASPKEKGISERLPDEPTPIYLYNTNEKVAVFINKVLVNEALAVSNVLPKDTEEASHRGRVDLIIFMH